eukprot:gene7921-9440_t
MLSMRVGLKSSRFVNRSGLNRLGGSVAAFRTNVPTPWDVAADNHNKTKGQNLLEDMHRKKFVRPAGPHALTSAPTGTYVPVSDEDVQRVPEGFAGELDHEFLFVGQDKPKHWMIRDSGKLLCNLLDEYKMSKLDDLSNYTRHPSTSLKVEFEGLTDRLEWHDTEIVVQHYGDSVLPGFKKSLKASGVRNILEERPNITEDLLGAIKEKVPQTPTRIMLAGDRGVGKSVALNQAVVHARRNNWLVLFIPNGWEHAQGGSYIQPCLMENQPFPSTVAFKSNDKVITNEDELEEMELPTEVPTDANTVFDNHEMSAQALRGFLLAHEAQLKTIPIRDTAIMNKYTQYRLDFNEAVERIMSVQSSSQNIPFVQTRAIVEGTDAIPLLDKLDGPVLKDFNYLEFKAETLADICTFGVAFRQLAGSLFVDLVNELREYNNPNMPVLIAVDEYNNWEVPSAYSYNNQRVHAKQLCVPHSLNFLSLTKHGSDHWSLKNGMAIGTTSSRYLEGLKVDYAQQKKSLPLCVTVPYYNKTEYLSALAYYTHHDIFAPNLHLHDLLGLRTFTSSNPRLLRAQGIDFVLPLGIEYNHEATTKEAEDEDAQEMMAVKRSDMMDAKFGEEDDDEFSEEEEEVLPNTPQNKKILLARAKAKAEKEKAIEAEKAAKIAAEEARNSLKFDKPSILAYLSNKDKKFLRMKDGRG